MIDLIETIFSELNIDCYYISKESIETTEDFVIYNIKDKGEVYADNNVVRKEYTVYLNYYIVDGTTLESKKEILNKKLREYRFYSRGTDLTHKESTGYYNTSLSFYYYK